MTRQRDVYDAGIRGDWALLLSQLEATPLEERRRRRVICYRLKDLRPGDAVPALRRVAGDTREDRGVRIGALMALRDIGDPAAIPEVLELLHRGPPRAGREAADVLALIGREQAEPELLKALDAEDKGARAASARVLGQLGSEQAIDALARKVSSDDHIFVRQEAGRALHRIGTPESRERLDRALAESGPVPRWRIRYWIRAKEK